jgi:hypothetical protein
MRVFPVPLRPRAGNLRQHVSDVMTAVFTANGPSLPTRHETRQEVLKAGSRTSLAWS